ncbi:metal ABC transporter ATP-binding protein [Clostridium tarantellae]|uniref:ATP-binding cassette domain-containing protein n=1 Tax=Clostridium tarantellae TaxID=39493 RepID=A0A6I1MKW9_9CLOT|nr:metal ABC transporter ATP-binding protein [Clostridium tarantellae]MPQ44045.1 ATP-binding cassette domain-containing protein [Clostridium tarantellae]
MININNLCFSYNGTKPYQLDHLNLSFPTEGFISIVGENGSYKTTLLKLILSHLKPCKGSVEIKCDSIGYVPQKIDNFNPQFSITVYEVLKIHLKALKIKDSNEINKVLQSVNMLNFKNKLIGSLSGGQQQRIFIARALMGNPKMIILDEPTTGIDEKTQEEIYKLLYKLNKENNITIVTVEHNKNTALKYSSHILELKFGIANLYDLNEYIKKINDDTFKRKVN